MTPDQLEAWAERASIMGDDEAAHTLPDGVTPDDAWAQWDAYVASLRCVPCGGTGWTGARTSPDADGLWYDAHCMTCGGTGSKDA
jgi:hypothetical protein